MSGPHERLPEDEPEFRDERGEVIGDSPSLLSPVGGLLRAPGGDIGGEAGDSGGLLFRLLVLALVGVFFNG